MAWPVDVADGQVLLAAHVNAIKESVKFWPGDVNGSGQLLVGPRAIHINSTGAPLGLLQITAPNVTGVDSISAIILDRAFGEVGDSMDIVWGLPPSRSGRIACLATGGGEAGIAFYAQTAGGDGYGNPMMRMDGNGHVLVYNLRSTNPGGGSKQLWYDPADGNRVKFAP